MVVSFDKDFRLRAYETMSKYFYYFYD
jgi:hypothetical protein